MGRMFEALRQADDQVDAADEQRLSLVREPEPQASVPDEVRGNDDAEPASDVPFIEVGPNRSIEASPGLLDRPVVAPSRRAVRPTDEEPVLAPAVEPSPAPAPRPMTISFRPPPAVAENPGPRPCLAPELAAFHCPEHPTSARYRDLLASLTVAAIGDRAPAFLFTSALFGAGTTTVLLNLAITAARQGRRVVVVDANMRRPGIASRLHLEEAPGLRDVLGGAAALDDALQETAQVNLLVLTAGSRRSDGVPRLIGGTMRSVLRDLRRKFDLILIDGPRWDGRPDVVAAAVACDAVFVVVPEDEAETPQVDQLLQVIPEQGARLGGCVLVAID